MCPSAIIYILQHFRKTVLNVLQAKTPNHWQEQQTRVAQGQVQQKPDLAQPYVLVPVLLVWQQQQWQQVRVCAYKSATRRMREPGR